MEDKTMKILILEDMKADAELLKRAVLSTNKGVLFTLARNEEEFITRMEWGSYDLVLADYHLPNYNGLKALLFIREHYGDLPFIFVTGSLDSEEAVARAILKGANGYILKGDNASIAERFEENMARIRKDREQREQRVKENHQRELKLQKIHHLLVMAEDFSGKQEIERLLSEILSV